MPRDTATLTQLVEEGLPRNATGVAFATKRGGRWIETSVADFRRNVEHLALGLRALGVAKGDRVALHAENSAEWITADQAILSLGAVVVPIYTTQPGDQVEFILRDAEAAVYLVSTPALWEGVASRIANVPSLRATVGILGSHADGMLAWEDVLASGRDVAAGDAGLFARLRAEVRPDDLASLIYTSGTTGMPKGVMLTHGNLASNVLASLERMPFDIEADRGHRILSYLPLSHVFERMLSYLYLHIGFPVWFVERFEEMLTDLQHVRPIHFSSVPRLLEKVHAGIHAKPDQLHGAQKKILQWGLALADRYDLETPLSLGDRVQYALADALVFRKLRALFGGNLKAITSGGAALSKEVMNFLNAIGIFCGQGYGLSETSPVVSVFLKDELRAGSVGKPIRGTEVRIADDGEILVRGPQVMQGYFRNPTATAEVLDADGWFHTGDVGHLDPDGYLFVTDRKKELLKLSTGKYVAPAPIETRLKGSRFVEHAVVIGNGRQFVTALVVLNVPAVEAYLAAADGKGASPLDVEDRPEVRALIQAEVDAANAGLPAWEQVKRFELLAAPWSVDGGELTPTLKIKRRVVHEKHAKTIETMYA